MAIKNTSEVYSHAVIDTDDMTITEYDKDESRVYSIMEILKRWDGVEEIKLTIGIRGDIEPEEGG